MNEDDNAVASTDLSVLTAEIVAAYVSHNSIQVSGLPALIASVHASLTNLGSPSASAEPTVEKASSAEIRKSIKPDGLVSFIDGRSYKTLKRHLSKHGFDGMSYRAKYGLPNDYPMVAASYAAQRSELAKSLGLGQIRRSAAAASLEEVKAEPGPTKKVGRPRKAKAA